MNWAGNMERRYSLPLIHKLTNTIHFFTTHRLKMKINWEENKERWWSFHSYTNTIHFFTTHPLNLRIDWVCRVQVKAVLIFTHKLVHKHNTLFYNSPTKNENELGEEHGKVVYTCYPSYTNTQTQYTSLQLTG